MPEHTMTRLQVPSADFWTIAPFTISTPDGWSTKQTADQLVYMSADGEPSTNCGVQWKRVPRGLRQPTEKATPSPRRRVPTP